MKKHLLLSTLLVAVALPAWADKNPRTGEELADNQAYTYRMLDSVKSLDPQLISSVEDSDVARGLFEGLFNEDGDGNLVPAGAVSFDVSDDKLTYTFHLRPESKWSDGTPVTAADYVYGWQRLVDPALASEYAYYLELAQVKNAADITAGKKPATDLGVKAVDDLTLEVTLDNPIPYFTKMLTNTSTFPAPKAAIEKFGADWTKPENIVTNGAYLLKEFIDGEKYVEEKNPAYWDAASVIMSPVTALVINDEDAALTRYQAGELDRTEVPTGQYPHLKEEFPAEANSTPYACAYDYIINVAEGKGNEALKDVRVRKALSYAVDRDVIVNNILQGGQTPAYSWTPPAINGYVMPDIDYSHWTQAERNDKAKALLAEAGYGPDHPLQLTLNYNTSDGHKKIAVAIQQMWKQTLGVELTPNNYEWKVHTDKLIAGDFEMARYAWCADYNEASTFLDLYASYSTNNDGKFANADYDKLLKDAKTMADPSANYTAAEQILATEMPIIPIYHYAKVDMVKPDLKGLPQHDVMQFWYAKDLYRIKQ
ncbi:MAG: peptide ABC transporter substrate-binding protein [Pseudomonadota bacterium]